MTADLAAALDALQAEVERNVLYSRPHEHDGKVWRQMLALVKVAKAANQVSAGPEGFASYSALLHEALAALREQLANHEQEER